MPTRRKPDPAPVPTPVATASLAEALLLIQSAVPPMVKSATNPHFRNKYVPLEDVVAAVIPIAAAHGVLISQPLGAGAYSARPAVVTRLTHVASGETLEYAIPLVLEKETPQGVGAAITYMRRYALLSALCLVADADDDAEASTIRGGRQKPAEAPQTSDPAPAPDLIPGPLAPAGTGPAPWE